jgi:colanic acid biosynthesis glycosyl transferase WcaI
MRILVFNQYFSPDVAASAQRMTELLEDLATDFEVTIVAGRPSYAPVGGDDRGNRPARLRVIRVPSTSFPRYRPWQRIANYVSYLIAASVVGLTRPRPDIVVAGTDPPFAAAAAWLVSRRFGVPFVYLLWDVQPQAALAAGLMPDGHLARAMRRATSFLVARAAGVVTPTAAMAATAIELGAPKDRVVVHSHWEDPVIVRVEPRDNAFSRAHGLADRFVVMYAGNLGLTQQLDRYLALARRLEDLKDLVFVFLGDGAARITLEAAAASHPNVRFLPYQPRDTMSRSLGSADVFFAPLATGLTRYMLPSKIYTFLASGRPIVAAIDEHSDVADLVRTSGAGVVTAPADLDGLEREFRRLHADPGPRQAMGRAGRAALEATYARDIVTGRYARWFRQFGREARS